MILVVGATGFLGSEICRQLSDAPHFLCALVRSISDVAKKSALPAPRAGWLLTRNAS